MPAGSIDLQSLLVRPEITEDILKVILLISLLTNRQREFWYITVQ